MKKLIIILVFTLINSINANDKFDFFLLDTKGNQYTKTNTNGKFLVLNFWATWCPPCIEEIPELVSFYDEYKNQVEILGMDYDKEVPVNEVNTFIDGFMVNYPIVIFKGQEKEFKKFNITYLPTSYIYNKKGKLLKKYQGAVTSDKLIKIMDLK